jgi:hypothetical protein
MVNDPLYTAQQADWRLDVSDAWQVLWWCRYLAITKSQLEAAINVVGNKIGDIQQYLSLQEDTTPPPPPTIPGIGVGTIRPDFRHRTPF